MAAGVTDAVDKDSQTSRSSHAARKPRIEQVDGAVVPRFFLAQPGGSNSPPEFSKEFSGESEAIVESLKSGLSYYVVSEWRGVADLSGKRPQLGREAVCGTPKAR